MTQTPSSMPPGWYPDHTWPQQLQRFWDGQRWTDHTAPAAPPAAPSAPAVAGPSGGVPNPYRAASAAPMPAARGAQAITCPHCGTAGKVKTKRTKAKKGISGGKATGAVLTLGVSTLATGLSRKEHVTEMSCGQCKMKWVV